MPTGASCSVQSARNCSSAEWPYWSPHRTAGTLSGKSSTVRDLWPHTGSHPTPNKAIGIGPSLDVFNWFQTLWVFLQRPAQHHNSPLACSWDSKAARQNLSWSPQLPMRTTDQAEYGWTGRGPTDAHCPSLPWSYLAPFPAIKVWFRALLSPRT